MPMNLPDNLDQFSKLLIDSYFVIDLEHNIVDFNRAFYSMLPRPLARNLKTRKCHQVLQLEICHSSCIARQCWEQQRAVRLDEIAGTIPGTEDDMTFILSAIPIFDDAGQMIGAMELQRNVTDEALVQNKYQRQMDASAEEKRQLVDELQRRTKRLFDVSRRMRDAQQELLRLKTGPLER